MTERKFTRPDLVVQERQDAIDYKAFADEILKHWPEVAVCDMDELQEVAIKHGLLRKVEGGFYPEKHIDLFGCAEIGDDWYERTTE